MLNWANVFCFKCVILVYIERFPHFTNKRIFAFYFFYGKKIHVTVVMSLEPEMWSHWSGGVHLGGVGDGAQVPGAPPLGRMSGLTNILWMKPTTISVSFFTGNHINNPLICAGYLRLDWENLLGAVSPVDGPGAALEVQLETISLIISFIILCRMQNCGITIYSMNSNFISCIYI